MITRILTRKLSPAVLQISINRPSVRNAVDRTTAAELVAAFRDFEKDETSSVAVFSGEGSCFCAGADLKAVSLGGEDVNDVSKLGPMGPTGIICLDKPVICAIEGACVAGGLELACWCDMRVAARSARLGVLCRRVGVPLVDGGTVRLPRLIGQSNAMDLIVTGREVDAAEAKSMGLVNRVVEDGSAVEAAQKLAEQIAAFPQTCLRNDRRSVYESAFSPSLEAALENEIALGRRTLASGESKLGATDFALGKKGRGGSTM